MFGTVTLANIYFLETLNHFTNNPWIEAFSELEPFNYLSGMKGESFEEGLIKDEISLHNAYWLRGTKDSGGPLATQCYGLARGFVISVSCPVFKENIF